MKDLYAIGTLVIRGCIKYKSKFDCTKFIAALKENYNTF